MKEIENIEDVTLLVEAFYSKAFVDPKLSPHFEGMDFEAHKPKMIAFWAFVLLDQPGYTTNVFDKHTHLKIDSSHFNQWIKLFHAVVDEHFIGEKANDAKLRATTIGWTFGNKMEQLHKNQ